MKHIKKFENSDFENGLEIIVNEFNSLNAKGFSPISGRFDIKAEGQIHFHDYFLCLNVNGLKFSELEKIYGFLKKYDGNIVMHPEIKNNSICIRIDDEILNKKMLF